jgi:hypothetical protein
VTTEFDPLDPPLPLEPDGGCDTPLPDPLVLVLVLLPLDELVLPPPPPDEDEPPPELEPELEPPLDVRGIACALPTAGTASPRATAIDATWRTDLNMAATPEVRARTSSRACGASLRPARAAGNS